MMATVHTSPERRSHKLVLDWAMAYLHQCLPHPASPQALPVNSGMLSRPAAAHWEKAARPKGLERKG